MRGRSAVVFCSANSEIDPEFNVAAREVVRAVCEAGYTVVSGGTTKGTMDVVARSAMEFSGHHKGVLPRFMEQYKSSFCDELVWTDKMSERKDAMREGTSLAIALPGGIGTLDELVETVTLAKLGKYGGKIVVYNCKGFYDPLRELLDHFVKTKTFDAQDRDMISFPSGIEELKKLL